MTGCLARLLLFFSLVSGGVLALLPSYEEAAMSPEDAMPALRITIVYENELEKPGLIAGWGFAALVEYGEHTLLFDTGADGPALLSNMVALGIDPLSIDTVILSHNHADHTGGLGSLLSTGLRPRLVVLPSFPAAFKQWAEHVTELVIASPGVEIVEGIITTGEMAGSTPEQALIIRVDQGMVILTGCAHPGIVAIVERAQALTGQPVALVLGGFHLADYTSAQVTEIIQAFRRLGVERAGPCHCTGERAIAAFAQEYGPNFVRVGTGSIIEIGMPNAAVSD